MDGLDELVDQVIAAFRARRRTGWSPTGMPTPPNGGDLSPWRERIQARLRRFRSSVVDRASLLERARRRYIHVLNLPFVASAGRPGGKAPLDDRVPSLIDGEAP